MIITAYITKWCLTKGIKKAEGEWNEEFPCSFWARGEYSSVYGEGRDWHRTYAPAVARAEQMRLAKIASLRKQITKLEALKFEEKP